MALPPKLTAAYCVMLGIFSVLIAFFAAPYVYWGVVFHGINSERTVEGEGLPFSRVECAFRDLQGMGEGNFERAEYSYLTPRGFNGDGETVHIIKLKCVDISALDLSVWIPMEDAGTKARAAFAHILKYGVRRERFAGLEGRAGLYYFAPALYYTGRDAHMVILDAPARRLYFVRMNS